MRPLASILDGVAEKLGSLHSDDPTKLVFGKRGLLEKGSFQKSPFSRDSRESRDFWRTPRQWKIKETPTIF